MGDAPFFMGRANIHFHLGGSDASPLETKQTIKKDLFLDFHGEEINEVQINGVNVPLGKVAFRKHRIYIAEDVDLLDPHAINTVTIKFTNSYVNNSAGLHRSVDAKDGNVYIYSHLEPFNCHRWFPCFDQPSIRAPLNLQVITPKDIEWKVVGNAQKEAVTPITKELLLDLGVPEYQQYEGLLHRFEESAPISTYIYGMTAGNFKKFSPDVPHPRIPMAVYTSQSKAPHFDAQEMIRVTQIGIEFYESFFGVDYPFTKYDQIFLPEFRIGGMENAGCVTYNDVLIKPQSETTDALRFRLAYITLHELAHMWFGDLVTMHWWNDLWLKESFADFMALVCMTECKTQLMQEPFKGHIYKNPEVMNTRFIDNALELDVKKSVTHPI